ncbi:cation acetate symporter [Alicyclobacillus macrosporangiidus]|uniref:solute symporter family protein n=1 Tax=Alicyclobacillus macrosporangiidus TaxID=392015 RepID=UPI00068D5BF3|nr:cation acetate symporter [Alicyclobacillus macrosporangiidus]
MSADEIFFLCAVVSSALLISYWSARTHHDTDRFYAASRGLTGMQNGLAIAGDFASAASLLGVCGAMAQFGFDGFLYAASFFASYLLLWTVAEPVHRLGRYTLADALERKLRRGSVRTAVAINTLVISIAYLIPQLVAAGQLAQSVFGLPHPAAVWLMGGLMTLYVAVGGMVSTSWVQMVKSVLMLATVALLTLMLLARFEWNLPALLAAAPSGRTAPGALYSSAASALSVHVPIVLGTLGMPHILVRFLTVPSPVVARRSLAAATGALGLFYLMLLALGWGVLALGIRPGPGDPHGNLVLLTLTQALGGRFFTAFVSAVALTTILAVVTGLLLCATGALSHDLLHRGASSSGDRSLRSARLCAGAIGIAATGAAAMVYEGSVTTLVSLVFTWAAATHTPVLLCTFYWRGFTARGALAGLCSGSAATVALIAAWPPWSAVSSPLPAGLAAIAAGFAGCVLGSLAGRQKAPASAGTAHEG